MESEYNEKHLDCRIVLFKENMRDPMTDVGITENNRLRATTAQLQKASNALANYRVVKKLYNNSRDAALVLKY